MKHAAYGYSLLFVLKLKHYNQLPVFHRRNFYRFMRPNYKADFSMNL